MTPESCVTNILRTLDLSSRDLDKIRAGHEKWPRWCFVPFSVWTSSLVRSSRSLEKVNEITNGVTVVPWRYSRSVYRFDPDVYRELVETPFSGEIPQEVLLRLPEWSVYVEMQEETVSGFFASLDFGSPERAELLFVFCQDERLVPFNIRLSSGTIEDSFAQTLKEFEALVGENNELKADCTKVLGKDSLHIKLKGGVDGVREECTEILGKDLKLVKKALSLILYICSDEAEIRDRDTPDWEPGFPRPKMTKGQERLFPADRNRIVDVGQELGAMLREGAAHGEPGAPTGRTVRPHLRRGHWHGFWTGPRKENRDLQKFVLKWLPPIYVHGRGA